MKRYLLLFLFFLPATLWSLGGSEELAPGLYARITTNRGVMVAILDYEHTPLTTTNFSGLAEGSLPNSYRSLGEPYYDGLTFYRASSGYVVFSGDPTNSGEGGPGYTLPRELGAIYSAKNPGTLMMDGFSTETAGSRFLITQVGDAFLDSRYTAFGQLIDGRRTLKKLQDGDIIESIRIVRVGDKAEELRFDKETFDRQYQKARELEIENLVSSNPDLADVLASLGDHRVKTPTGIYYSVLQTGEGDSPSAGSKVSMRYTGTLLDGTVFDISQDSEQTFDFVLGRDGIISGWVEMVMGMKSGEVRKVLIPPGLAYGEGGYGPIEPNSWLVFEMELVSFAES